MRVIRWVSRLLQLFGTIGSIIFSLTTPAQAAPANVGVAVLQAAAWAPGDSTREGAGEFEVLLRIAQLQRAHAASGLVSVGDRHGMRPCGGEHALSRATLTGVPVVKLAPRGEVAASPDGLFLDGGNLTADQAVAVLRHCLIRHGAPPVAADPAHSTRREIAAIRAHLEPFQTALRTAALQNADGLLASIK